LSDGSFPPPPLNGTAHTWHHPISLLLHTINNGGKALGGQIPAFGGKLSDAEKTAVIAYFQNRWPDEIYDAWIRRGGLIK
jgi:mono/diheme cytochrome c family protein